MDPFSALTILQAGRPVGGLSTLPSATALGAAQARLGLVPQTSPGLADQQAVGLLLLGLLARLMVGQGGSGAAAGSTGTPDLAGLGTDSSMASPSGSTASPSGSTSSSTAPSGSTASPSGASLGSGDKVDPAQLEAYLEQKIAGSKLNGFVPRDGAQHGVDGSARSWAKFMVKLAQLESSFKNSTVGDQGSFQGGSRGLFQLSYHDAQTYGLNGGKPFTAAQLADPKLNADTAVTIMERLVTRDGSITGGAGKYWGPIKRGKL